MPAALIATRLPDTGGARERQAVYRRMAGTIVETVEDERADGGRWPVGGLQQIMDGMQDVQLLFDPFYSGKGQEGRGLGLYIARQLPEGYGYRIEVADDRLSRT